MRLVHSMSGRLTTSASHPYTANEKDESDNGRAFAYGPPPTSEYLSQPHQMQYSQHQLKHQYHHQQDKSQHQHLNAAQRHNLVSAAGLSTSSSTPPALPSVMYFMPESPSQPNSHPSHAQDHPHYSDNQRSYHKPHTHPPGTSSTDEYKPGPNPYLLPPIPVSPGLFETQHTNPTLDPISYAHIPGSGHLQVVLPTTARSNTSSERSPAQLKRDSSYPSGSALELGSQDFTMSYKDTDMDLAEEEEDSPYAEVRASVSNIDDPEMPTMTFRMWFLGLTLVCISVLLNTFFNFRYPAPAFIPSLVLLIAYPLGKALALILPIRTWVLPRILGGGKVSLNPGPFNVKEHVLIYMMVNVGAFPSYVLNAIVVADKYYGLSFGPRFEVLLILSTTLTGFGLAGFCRTLLVKPASMVWPQNLVSCALLNTLHAEDDDRTGGMTRYKFFIYVMTGTFLWTFVPGFLFVGLSFFSWACWIAPSAYPFLSTWVYGGATNEPPLNPAENLVVNQLFGTVSGLGMGFITFDWSQISYISSPLMVPWWAQVHVFAGFVVMYWLVLPILYYTNVCLPSSGLTCVPLF